jgi:hypothetical protein
MQGTIFENVSEAASAAKSPRGRKRTPASRFTQMG